MITGISEFGFFCPKMAVSWRITSFQKKIGWNPYFYSVFGCAFSGPRCQKRQFLDTLSKKKFLTDNWKAHFLVFLCFLLFLSLFCFFWFFCVVSCFVFLCFFVFCFFGGFKGQARWPKGAPHLALNPPYFLFVFFVFVFFSLLCFLCFLNRQKKPVFPPRKGHFLFIFYVSLSFSLNLFGPPPFSVSLSLSLAFSCLSSFLSFFFAFFWFLVFVSFSCFFLLCFCFLKRTTWTFSIAISFFLKYFLFLLVSCLAFLFQIPFSYLCFFLILSYVFVQHQCFKFQKELKTQKNKKKATKRFFL